MCTVFIVERKKCSKLYTVFWIFSSKMINWFSGIALFWLNCSLNVNHTFCQPKYNLRSLRNPKGITIEEELRRILSPRSRPAPTPPCGYVAVTDSTAISWRGGGLLYCYSPTIMRAAFERCHQNQFPGYVLPERGRGLDDFGYWVFYVILLQWELPLTLR